MKLKTILVVALAAAVPALAYAKKPKKAAEEAPAPAPAVVEEDPVITEECMMNVSLFHEAVKNKMYADAYGPWWEVYTTCPNANKSIYSDGSKIVEALYQAASDPAEKERLAKLAVEMQDKRIRFFGNDPKYPKAYILGEKGLAYLDFFGETKLAEARECLRQSVEGMAAGSKILVLVKLVDASYALYKQDPNGKAEQFIADYELASTYLGEQASNTNNKNAVIAGKQKDYVDNIINYSKANEIELVLCTIPSVPNINHEQKNEYVRKSGLRYIDFAKAVENGKDNTWKSGMLSIDNVHPTELGAIALYMQAISDVPELFEL